ncbi:MAG TPA: gamma-glutamyl-gamma-aminobutyrate hydrolase family protein [Pseudonocardia sp.]|jgi:putative glutamine amidotransferase|nr:gamma-glutamyl-gamma-aminobutyrate hydrolase family protein [Pseudonocardia sp.]
MSRPLIALTSYSESVNWGVWKDVAAPLLPWPYVSRVADAGGAPLLFPPLPETVPDVLGRIDGLIVTGGPDVDPDRYGAQRDRHTQPPDPARDDTELAALELAQQRGVPVLAICRGAQVLAVSRGGTLHQHLPTHRPRVAGQFEPNHIRIAEGSRLAEALGTSSTMACHHHQGIDEPGSGLVVTAWNDEGGIEGVEDPSLPYFVAVQPHPEEPGDTAALFAAFVDAAARFQNGS